MKVSKWICAFLSLFLLDAAVAADSGENQLPKRLPPRKKVQPQRKMASTPPTAVTTGSGFSDFRITYDLGASTGSYSNKTYTEINLGVNLYVYPFLAWRNAAFARFLSGANNVYGLDSSVRGILELGGSGLGMTAFAGPGFRFVNEGRNVPFGEAGAVFKLGGLNIGGGVKTLFNKFADSALENDTQYFIILAGGGSL